MEVTSEPPKKKRKDSCGLSNEESALYFFAAVSSECTLSFKSSVALRRFATIAPYVFSQSDEATTPMLSIELDMFREDVMPKAAELENWEKIDCPHGVGPGARDHFMAWMEAVRLVLELRVTLRINIRMRKPFRDYHTIRQLSVVLRDPKITLEVNLDNGTWDYVPGQFRYLLMAMVEFSITGLELDKDFEDQRRALTEDDYVHLRDFGCYAIRLMKALSYRQGGNREQQ